LPEPTTPPGWYDDPDKLGLERYWDGRQWTEDTQPKAKPKPAQKATPVNPRLLFTPAKEKSSGGLGCGLIVLIVFVLWAGSCIASGGGSGGSGGTRADVGSGVGAWVICQDFVEDRLTAPSTAEYPAGYSQYTTSLGDRTFRVDAYVDAENSFGAMIRTDFTCTVRYQGSETWRLVSLEFDE
jgi:hypothetical protein